MLEPADQGFATGQVIEEVALVNFEEDDTPEIVVAISNVGATAGPLDLWIISMNDADELRTEYYFQTQRGGEVTIGRPVGERTIVLSNVVAIEFGVYRRDDPGCCPSRFEVRTIGYDPALGGIGVLKRERHSLETG